MEVTTTITAARAATQLPHPGPPSAVRPSPSGESGEKRSSRNRWHGSGDDGGEAPRGGPCLRAAHLSDRHRRPGGRLREPLRAMDARHRHPGCPFLTPVSAIAPPEARRAALDRDLAEDDRQRAKPCTGFHLPDGALVGDRDHRALRRDIPHAPRRAPPRAGRILHKLDEVELAKLGPLASLQLTRLPLSRTEVALKRVFDLVFAAAGLVLLTPLIVLVAALIAFEDRGRCSLRSAATDSISSHSASSSSAPCTPKTTVRSCRRRRATTRA